MYEQRGRIAFRCELCDNEVFVGDEYYNIPGVGKCCTSCIDDCHQYDAEDENYNAYIDARIDEMKEDISNI